MKTPRKPRPLIQVLEEAGLLDEDFNFDWLMSNFTPTTEQSEPLTPVIEVLGYATISDTERDSAGESWEENPPDDDFTNLLNAPLASEEEEDSQNAPLSKPTSG